MMAAILSLVGSLAQVKLNWRVCLALFLGALCVFFVWDYRNTLRKNEALEIALKGEKAQLQNCQRISLENEKVSDEYQSNASDLDRRLRELKRMHGGKSACVPVRTAPAPSPDGTAAGRKLLRPDGIDPFTLLEYARNCERERLKLKGLQATKKPAR